MSRRIGPAAPRMNVVVPADQQLVFDVLTDPSTYPEWLVGAQHIRWVDPDWPRPGATFHHRIGCDPLSVPGSTTLRSSAPPDSVVLSAGMGPFGEATVRFRLRTVDDGTEVEFAEEPSGGLARLAYRLGRPAVALALWGRNGVSLAGLSRVVLGRVEERGPAATGPAATRAEEDRGLDPG